MEGGVSALELAYAHPVWTIVFVLVLSICLDDVVEAWRRGGK